MNNISQPFIERPVATTLVMIAILICGFIGYNLLPISALPEVDYPTIQITTFYPGASPDVIASLVTSPLEKQLGQMPGLNQMTSTSSGGSSLITLQFNLNMSLDVAEQEVQAAINAAGSALPSDLPNPPIYSKVNPADTPILTLALTSKTIPLTKVEDLADTRLSQKIAQISGVGLVTLSGGQRPAIRIQVNPEQLASYKLNMEDVRAAVNGANVNMAKGSLDGPKVSYTINANDQLLSSSEYKNIIISYKNGAPIRLKNIAQVIDAAENSKQSAWMNNEPAILMNIQRQPGANIIAVVDNIKNLLPKLTSSMPSDIKVTILTDRTITIRHSIQNALFELILAIALVILVIFIFLQNLPATLIPGIAVPMSLIGTFAMMYELGFSLNNLTLMALTISTGFVVDDAIVMIENIARYNELGFSPKEAALQGSKQIGFTIISLTFSLIASLIPLLFMNDVVGRLFREFALTLTISILISAFISLTLTPMLCAKFLKHRHEKEKTKFELKAEQTLNFIILKYGSSLRWVLNRQNLILGIAVVTLICSLSIFYFIPKGFFPLEDTGIIQGISQAPPSVSFEEMKKRQSQLTPLILNDPAVESVSSFIGIDGINTTLNSGRVLINLKPIEQRDRNALQVIERLQNKITDETGIDLFLQPVQDISIDDRISRNQYQFSLTSTTQEDVSFWSKKFVHALSQVEGIKDVTSNVLDEGLQTKIEIDRDSAARVGITPVMIDNVLYNSFGQRQISTLFTQVNQYHVILEVAQNIQNMENALEHLFIVSPSGSPVPLSTFTKVTKANEPLSINRQGQFPSSTISFNLESHASLGEAVKAIESLKKTLNLPDKVQLALEGSAKIFQNSLSNEFFLVCAAIFIIYIVLGILYENAIHPVTILSSLPSAAIGAGLALYLFKLNLNLISLIGIILLIGIVKKNAIMMIDFALDLQKNTPNLTPRDAIYEACLLRFRPILMTTMAALLGAVPLALAGGMGAELRKPLGIAIIGGLMVSQVLTLYTTPVIYLWFDKLSNYVSKKKKESV